MKSPRGRFRISSRAIQQSVAAAGVIASLAFVGMQIRESNIQARAAAYQAIGIATSEFHRGFTPRMNRLMTESSYPEAVKRWNLEDWETVERIETADLRMLETILLQVEQGLLPRDATARLGYNWGPILSNPAVCVSLARPASPRRSLSPQVHRRLHTRGQTRGLQSRSSGALRRGHTWPEEGVNPPTN